MCPTCSTSGTFYSQEVLLDLWLEYPTGFAKVVGSIIICNSALHLLFQLNSCTPDEFYCWQMLEETGITPIAGTHFGQKEGTYHFRSGHFIYVDKAVAG